MIDLSQMKYTKTHEWLRLEGAKGTVGITQHAQEEISDVVFVELPKAGRAVVQGEEVAVVESVKAASEVYAPVSGEVVEVNTLLSDAPATVNEDAEGKGWFVKLKISDKGQFAGLLDEAAYKALIG